MMQKSDSNLFIVDNSEELWKVREFLSEWSEISSSIDIATGYFEVGALLALGGKWQQMDSIRLIIGDEVSKRTKNAFTEGLKKLATTLDSSIEFEKRTNDFLIGVPAIVEALRSGKIQCRVYRKDKFHAKCYITHARQTVIGSFALVGSSNFTRPGLQDNVELNVQIRGNDVKLLQEWYEKHWEESEDVTADVLRIFERHTPTPVMHRSHGPEFRRLSTRPRRSYLQPSSHRNLPFHRLTGTFRVLEGSRKLVRHHPPSSPPSTARSLRCLEMLDGNLMRNNPQYKLTRGYQLVTYFRALRP